MSSTTRTQCCSAEALRSELSRPGPEEIQVLQCSVCRLNVWVVYDGNVHKPEDFLLDTTKPVGHYWLEVKGSRDRAVHYVLSQLLYQPDVSRGEVPYDNPDTDDVVKLFWWDQRAVSLFTVKPQGFRIPGTLYSEEGLPTLDTAFTLLSHRGQGLGLAMITELVSCYPQSDVALSYPLSDNMWRVVKKYLEQHVEMRRRLWLVKGDGQEGNRTLLWLCLFRQGIKES